MRGAYVPVFKWLYIEDEIWRAAKPHLQDHRDDGFCTRSPPM